MKKYLCLIGTIAFVGYAHAETVVVMSSSDYAKANKIATKTLTEAYNSAAQGELQRLFKMQDAEAKEGGMDSKLYLAVTQQTNAIVLERAKKEKEKFESDPFNSGSLSDHIKTWVEDNKYKVFSSECNKAGYPYMLFMIQGSDLMPKNHNCFQSKEQCEKFVNKVDGYNSCMSYQYVQDHKGDLSVATTPTLRDLF